MAGAAENPASPIAVLEPAGTVSARTWLELEREALARLAASARRFVVDLTQVEMINSVGLRVLVMLRQRLEATGGTLVLCGLCDSVRSVFEIAGLAGQFRVVASRSEALDLLERQPASAPAVRRSKLARLAAHLLEDGSPGERGTGGAPAAPPGLAARVSALLGEPTSVQPSDSA